MAKRRSRKVQKIGILTGTNENYPQLISSWLGKGYDAQQIRGFLGDNLVRYLKKIK